MSKDEWLVCLAALVMLFLVTGNPSVWDAARTYLIKMLAT